MQGRTQSVSIDGHVSTPLDVVSGVVQGSNLGPLLFILFINDIVDLISGPSKCKLFADDLKLYSSVVLESDADALQAVLNNVVTWSRVWQLSINSKKSCMMHAGRHNPNYAYFLDSDYITPNNLVRDLGIVYDSNLCFKNFVNSVVSRAYQRINLIFRAFCSRNLVLMTRVYTTYVRPILEYCSYIWSPYTLYEIDAIERVQSYFTRRLLPSIHPYNNRLARLKIDSLEERRIKIDLCMYFKILNKMIDLDSNKFFKIAPDTCVTRGHSFKLLKISNCNNDKELYAFHNRQINCWNSLPSFVVESPSFSSFKSRMKKVDLSRHCSGRVLASM